MNRVALALALLCGAAQEPTSGRVPDGPILIGLCVRGTPDASAEELAVHRGAELAVEAWNVRGGCLGRRVELVPAGGSRSVAEARAAAAEFLARGVAGVIAPLDLDCSEALVQACKRGPPVLVTAAQPELEAAALAQTCAGRLRCARVAFAGDGSAAAKALERALGDRLQHPYRLVLATRLGAKEAELASALGDAAADVLVLDAAPGAASSALGGALAKVHLPIVLSVRASGAVHAESQRELFFVQGRSPASAPANARFLETWRARWGEPGLGCCEALERTELLLRALEAARSCDPADVRAALAKTRLDGPRGAVTCSAAGEVSMPPALWRWDGSATPYVPSPLLAEPDGAARDASNPLLEAVRAPPAEPSLKLGVPFGALRTDAFRIEPGTQGVILSCGAPREATIDADLARIGLSTHGAGPLLDHLVKEELLARTLSIASRKYLRDALGRAVPGQSLKVTFAIHPAAGGEERGCWSVRLAGEDPDAAGRSWPGAGHSEVYTSNLLALLDGHELQPPLAPGDLELLDGSYRFGSDAQRDRRSELVRALIQSYAGSLGLTTAHEVGHLFGLEHTNGDPTDIMFAGKEQGGIDPDDAHFSDQELARLRKAPGVAR